MSLYEEVVWRCFSTCLLSRLTLVLSCAMKFESYPHDTQICSMMIESCKYNNCQRFAKYSIYSNRCNYLRDKSFFSDLVKLSIYRVAEK